ncbi:MAG: hypothetical protein GY793_02040 [Proteobacteria bacterium]|nr:hypothetical protein [Pseudomonadota bacterium]
MKYRNVFEVLFFSLLCFVAGFIFGANAIHGQVENEIKTGHLEVNGAVYKTIKLNEVNNE